MKRREFLEMLATLPVIGPALATSPTMRQFAVGGVVTTKESVLGMAGGQSILTANQVRALQGISEISRELVSYDPPFANRQPIAWFLSSGRFRNPPAPNRLLGAYVNADGDAV